MKVNGYEIEPRANLRGADLRGAVLSEADLRGAVLSEADLRGADLRWADLRWADLRGAVLRGADLRWADLRGAVLSEADLRGAVLPHFQICPEEGSFIGYKKVHGGGVIRILIPETARRTSSLVGRKCRAEFVEVLDGGQGQRSGFNKAFVYNQGCTVYPDKYDDDIRVECTHGIHFFMTRREAEEH